MVTPNNVDFASSFFADAHSYLLASDRLWMGMPKQPEFLDFIEPRRFLLNHSIELGLKSFLIFNGLNMEKLKDRSYGHNLVSLYEECLRRKINHWEKFSLHDQKEIENWNRLNIPGEYAVRYPNFKSQPATHLFAREFSIKTLTAIQRCRWASPDEEVDLGILELEEAIARNRRT